MFDFNRQVIKFIDNARTQPKNIGKSILNNFQDKFNGAQLYQYGKIIDTFQGFEAVKDFEQYMRQKQPTHPLIHSKALDQAAQLIAEQKGRQGKTQNEKPKIIYQQIQKFGKVNGKIGELISLQASVPEQIATYFLIDDGLASRKRRRMLLDSNYKYVGVGFTAHKDHKYIAVILLAENLEQNDTYRFEQSRVSSQGKRKSQRQIIEQVSKQNSIQQSDFY